MADEANTLQQRASRRQKTLKTGKILLPGGLSVIDCVIRDLSETGAKLEVGDMTSIPDAFRLVCLADQSMREATVMWRKDRRLGVAFSGEARRAPLLKW